MQRQKPGRSVAALGKMFRQARAGYQNEYPAIRLASYGNFNVVLTGSPFAQFSQVFIPLADKVFQLFAGKENTALDRAKWKLQVICNLLILEAVVVHQERDLNAVIKPFDHMGQLFHHDIGFSLIGNKDAPGVNVVQVVRRIHYGVGLNLLAIVIDEDVLHDGEKPRLEIGSRAKLFFVG